MSAVAERGQALSRYAEYCDYFEGAGAMAFCLCFLNPQ